VVHLPALSAIAAVKRKDNLAAAAVELGWNDLAAGWARRPHFKRQLGELVRESPHVELVGRERIARCARRCAATARAARRVPLVNVYSPLYHPTATSCLDISWTPVYAPNMPGFAPIHNGGIRNPKLESRNPKQIQSTNFKTMTKNTNAEPCSTWGNMLPRTACGSMAPPIAWSLF
jgi:hypothetical protein